jgi:hypothetical protein
VPKPPKPPFDLLKAVFLLLCAVVGVALLMLVASVGSCIFGVLSGRYPAGTCQTLGVNQLVHDTWQEILTACLALLVARGPPPPPPPE